MASQNVKTATDSNFESDILKSSGLNLVDFWAEWCGPCKVLGPKIDEIADEFSGKLGVFKMNVDENQATPVRYQIRGIPTVILFKSGQVVGQLVGNQPKEAFIEMIQKHL